MEKRTGMVWSDNSMRDSGLGSEAETIFSQLIKKKTTSGHLQFNTNLNNGIEKKEKRE